MSLPYFPLYPTDFEADTSHLTLAEDGAYNRLLRLMWMAPNCTLPNDDAWIMRRLRVDAETFEAVVRVVIDEFFIRKGGRLSNARLLEEHEKARAAHERRVSAGSKGGRPKSLKTNDPTKTNAKAMPKQPEPEPEPDKKEDTDVSSKGTLSTANTQPNDLTVAVGRYNDAAEKAGWPKVQRLNPARTKHLKARLADCGGLDGWEAALRRAFKSDFLRGRTRDPWTAFAFDWLIKSANFTKLMEGNYDNRTNQSSQPQGAQRRRSDPHSDLMAGFARAANRRDGGADADADGYFATPDPDDTALGGWPSGDFDEPILRVVGGGGHHGGDC